MSKNMIRYGAVIGNDYTGAIYGPLKDVGCYRSRRTLRRWLKKHGLPDDALDAMPGDFPIPATATAAANDEGGSLNDTK